MLSSKYATALITKPCIIVLIVLFVALYQYYIMQLLSSYPFLSLPALTISIFSRIDIISYVFCIRITTLTRLIVFIIAKDVIQLADLRIISNWDLVFKGNVVRLRSTLDSIAFTVPSFYEVPTMVDLCLRLISLSLRKGYLYRS